ncbi:hypothetical protein ACS0TY_032937 [Phlomoides rotata]
MPGRKFMNCDTYEKIEPPPVCKMPGRPKKKIIRGRNELTTRTSGKLSKIGKRMTCSSCHQEGHNSVKCSYKKSQEKVLPGNRSGKQSQTLGQTQQTELLMQQEQTQKIVKKLMKSIQCLALLPCNNDL